MTTPSPATRAKPFLINPRPSLPRDPSRFMREFILARIVKGKLFMPKQSQFQWIQLVMDHCGLSRTLARRFLRAAGMRYEQGADNSEFYVVWPPLEKLEPVFRQPIDWRAI